jgi:glycogen phosphorylase
MSRSASTSEQRHAGRHGGEAVAASPRLAVAIEAIVSGQFSPGEPHRFRPLTDAVLGADEFMTASDFDAYWKAQRAVDALWREPAAWWRMSILNVARMSWFSSDRTIREYAEDIWHIPTR